eukprot:Filipodium_phascolosomae@DN8735_c0_g1_i1.p1
MLAVSRALGDAQLKKPLAPENFVTNEPDVSVTKVTPEDSFVIMACDGLWDVMDDQIAVNLVSTSLQMMTESLKVPLTANILGQMVEMASRFLVDEALRRDTQDNVTCAVIILQTTPYLKKLARISRRNLAKAKSVQE